MLTIEDILDLREQYKSQVDTLLLKIEVLTDLMALAEMKEQQEPQTIEVFADNISTTITDESY